MTCFRETRIDVFEFAPELRHDLPLTIDDMSLAHHLGIRNKTLWWMVHAKRSKNPLYETFKLPKRGKSGGYRHIQNPIDSLKNVQRNILTRFLEPIPVASHVGAYVPGRSCRNTAEQHTKKAVIVSLDIKDFFPSVRRSMIRRFLHKYVGFNHIVSSLLAELMTYENFVPQGAPTSGLITNFVANFEFDGVILHELAKLDSEWTYTRYSDDIDLSHPEIQKPEALTQVINIVHNAIGKAGFELNQKKTKVEPHWRRQKVLGMVVNEKVNIPRLEYMRLRSIVHNCLVHGFKSQFQRAGMKSVAGFKSHIRGKLAFFKQVDKTKAARLKDKFELACAAHTNDKENEVSFDDP